MLQTIQKNKCATMLELQPVPRF